MVLEIKLNVGTTVTTQRTSKTPIQQGSVSFETPDQLASGIRSHTAFHAAFDSILTHGWEKTWMSALSDSSTQNWQMEARELLVSCW